MTLRELNIRGYDSLYAKRDTRDTKGVLYDEFVIYNTAQALPCYVIHYEKVDPQHKFTVFDLRAIHGSSGAHTTDNIKPRRQIDPNNHLDLHYRIAESQFLRLMGSTRQTHQITSVDLHTNPPLISKFKAKQSVMAKKYPGKPEADPILALHGTNPTNVPSIVKNNFSISYLAQNTGNEGAYGDGIYFSEFPAVSIGYGGNGCVILCEILPGRSYDCPGTMLGAGLMTGYDSHRARKDSEDRGHEMVIFDPDQILPRYVIHFH